MLMGDVPLAGLLLLILQNLRLAKLTDVSLISLEVAKNVRIPTLFCTTLVSCLIVWFQRMENALSATLTLYLSQTEHVCLRMSSVKKWMSMAPVLNVWTLTTIPTNRIGV